MRVCTWLYVCMCVGVCVCVCVCVCVSGVCLCVCVCFCAWSLLQKSPNISGEKYLSELCTNRLISCSLLLRSNNNRPPRLGAGNIRQPGVRADLVLQKGSDLQRYLPTDARANWSVGRLLAIFQGQWISAQCFWLTFTAAVIVQSATTTASKQQAFKRSGNVELLSSDSEISSNFKYNKVDHFTCCFARPSILQPTDLIDVSCARQSSPQLFAHLKVRM